MNGHIPIFLCSPCEISCLQVEPCGDTSGYNVPVILSNSSDDITSSGVPDVKQVNNNFLSCLTVLILNLLKSGNTCELYNKNT